MKIIEQLVASIREASEYNQNTQAAPAAILWTDKEKQWASAIPLLQEQMPELMVFGDYAPEKRTGPAIWLKCALENTLETPVITGDETPIIYLPGVSRIDIRAIESCPEALQPLAELQYRGALWSQSNGRDWTIFAWLKTSNGGLGLNVSRDDPTLAALVRALPHLLNSDIKELQDKRIESSDINQLLTIDAVKDLLLWMDNPEGMKSAWDQARWVAFEEVIHSEYGLSVQNDGLIGAAELLVAKDGQWLRVWNRFEESWRNYPELIQFLETVKPPADLFADRSSYARHNLEEESKLRQALLQLATSSPDEARTAILSLEESHGQRRQWVWADMGKAPLAKALEHLAMVATRTQNQLGGMSLDAMAEAYRQDAWQCDAAVLNALAAGHNSGDCEAIESALGTIYTPWLSACADHFQTLVSQSGYPEKDASYPAIEHYAPRGECVFFVDGLRYDTAKMLESYLLQNKLKLNIDHQWTALPTVTATAKASVTPVTDKITGRSSDRDFIPSLADKESAWSQHYLKKYLNEKGWQYLSSGETGDPTGLAWLETGDLDHYGHEHGLKLARELPRIFAAIEERLNVLMKAGWQKIRIVTDHGWLLVPGGLPKAELPRYLTETRWGRCALLKEGSAAGALTVGWYWNRDVSVAMAPGISSFVAGRVYEHGGLSLQECLTPVMSIESETKIAAVTADIDSVKWLGLTCKVAVSTEADISAQLRKSPADPDSAVSEMKSVKDGNVRLLVEDDDLEGVPVVIVLLDTQGNVLYRKSTLIGE